MTSQNVLERLGTSCRKCRTSFPSPSGIWNLSLWNLSIWNTLESLNLESLNLGSLNLESPNLSIWNLESRIFGRLHDGGDNARRRHDPRIATHRKHCTPHRSNAGRTPAHAVLAWLSPTWGSFRCAFSQVVDFDSLFT